MRAGESTEPLAASSMSRGPTACRREIPFRRRRWGPLYVSSGLISSMPISLPRGSYLGKPSQGREPAEIAFLGVADEREPLSRSMLWQGAGPLLPTPRD